MFSMLLLPTLQFREKMPGPKTSQTALQARYA